MRRLPLLALALLALGAGIALAAGGRGVDRSPQLKLLADGALALSDSRDGAALLDVEDLAPGETAEGTVTITNDGSMPGVLSLGVFDLIDRPGAFGGGLSARLELAVEDITSGSDALVYVGTFSRFEELELLPLAPGESRAYRFQVRLPDGGVPESAGSGDNAFQGSSVSAGFEWTLRAADALAAPCSTLLAGNSRPNRLIGTESGDLIRGRAGSDVIRALGGDDCAVGGFGRDLLHGGEGNDELSGNRGRDVIRGGDGDDVIHARGGGVDRIYCGPGDDLVDAGPKDKVFAC